MNDQTALDGLLRTWFAEDAARAAPPYFGAQVGEATRSRGQQPVWLARLTGGSTLVPVGSRRRTGGLLFAVALLAGTAIAAVAGALLSVGGTPAPTLLAQVYPSAAPSSLNQPVDGSPPPAPISRIYTSSTPWEFHQPTDVCGTGTSGNLPPGPLPQVGPPSIAHPHNGMIALDGNGETLVNPTTDKETSTLLPGVFGLGDGDQWSPDGHWLTIGLSGGDNSRRCTNVYVISSDGTRLVDVTGYPSDYQPISVAWSPDSMWLAVARWVAVPQLDPTATRLGAVPSDRVENPRGTAIDVLGIGQDGSVVDARRVWTSDAQGIGWLSWSSRGDLAWAESDSASPGTGLFVLRSGQTDTAPIDLRGAAPALPYSWSEDGQELVAVGSDASDDIGGIYVIAPSVGTVRFIAPAIPPRGGKYITKLFTSSEGRVFYAGGPSDLSTSGIYSATLDGTDVQQVTSSPVVDENWTWDAVLSPDETQVAFARDDGYGIWVVDAAGEDPARRLTQYISGLISWQPVP